MLTAAYSWIFEEVVYNAVVIPDLAVMLAAYMFARLFGTLFPTKQEHYAGQSQNLYLPSIVNIIALLIILYMAYDIHGLGQSVGDEMTRLKGLYPGSTP